MRKHKSPQSHYYNHCSYVLKFCAFVLRTFYVSGNISKINYKLQIGPQRGWQLAAYAFYRCSCIAVQHHCFSIHTGICHLLRINQSYSKISCFVYVQGKVHLNYLSGFSRTWKQKASARTILLKAVNVMTS